MLALSPVDIFGSVNTPMGAARLWTTWIGMAFFIALLFTSLRDLARHHQRLGPVSIGLAVIVVIAIVLFFLLPRA
ncbi:MAG TPA: hypothetical protein VN905_15815 [Candidatus Binatia bacterium]|nr:hypothetical protein [Candidatus Binatia bacterium]